MQILRLYTDPDFVENNKGLCEDNSDVRISLSLSLSLSGHG